MTSKSVKTVKIENIDQARKAGAEYGVSFPEGPGRPPMRKLAAAIKAAGHKITPTEYFTGEFAAPLPPALPGQAMYELNHTVRESYKDKQGKARNKTRKIVHRMNVSEIRKLVNAEGLRGPVSESRVLSAFAAKLELSETDLTGAQIIRIREGASKPMRAEVPAEPAKDVPKPASKRTAKVSETAAKPRKRTSAPKDTPADVTSVSESVSGPEEVTTDAA